MRQFIIRIRRLLGELSYAQNRALELRTGVSVTGPRTPSARARRQIERLDHVWGCAPAPMDAGATPDPGPDTTRLGEPPVAKRTCRTP